MTKRTRTRGVNQTQVGGWVWSKGGLAKAGQDIKGFVKKNHLVSRGIGAVSDALGGNVGKAGNWGAQQVKQAGWGGTKVTGGVCHGGKCQF